jgi:mono/diheme cytochrome c family protein
MAVAVFVAAFLALGAGVAFVAYSGGPSRAREAYLTGGRRGFKIAIPILYIALGIAVPAVVIASRPQAEGSQGALASKDGDKQFNQGKTAFRETCWSCHTLKAAGSQGITGTNLDQVVTNVSGPSPSATAKQRLKFVRHAIAIGGNGDGRMPPQLLTGKSADAVAYYVSQVAGK